MQLAVACLLGASTWTLLEYVLHRFVFHGASPRRLGAGEHRRHHADPDYFAPWWQKALAALATTAVLAPLAIAAAGATRGLVFTAGFIAAYLGYEVLHRRVHTHPPRNAYGRWRRVHHLAHHFHDPGRAHGVTTPFWDVVFRTRLPIERVRVPTRLATRWLVDEHGALRREYARDYELVGSRRRDESTRRADGEAAMRNRAPGAEPPTVAQARSAGATGSRGRGGWGYRAQLRSAPSPPDRG